MGVIIDGFDFHDLSRDRGIDLELGGRRERQHQQQGKQLHLISKPRIQPSWPRSAQKIRVPNHLELTSGGEKSECAPRMNAYGASPNCFTRLSSREPDCSGAASTTGVSLNQARFRAESRSCWRSGEGSP